jgi:hypothetical protein
MNVIETGVLRHGVAGTSRAAYTFPCLSSMPDGTLLATCRAGSTKDSADEMIELYRSDTGGRSWDGPFQPFGEPRAGLKLCYLTQPAPGRLLAAGMWVDHAARPGLPLFNPATEGCLPMAILLAESSDAGVSWSPWRSVPIPAELGPPSLTAPALAIGDEIVLSVESNKHYDDSAPWRQRVVLLRSRDGGRSWDAPVTVGEDPRGRIFNWDQRLALGHDRRIAAFTWTYDRTTGRYLNIHRRISEDGGASWSAPEDLGFADQPGRPAVLADGRIVLPYVDRFGSRAIRARIAPDIAAPFDPASDTVIYTHGVAARTGAATGDLLADMSEWSFGLPYAETLPDGDVLTAYYAGTDQALDIRWARLRIDHS